MLELLGDGRSERLLDKLSEKTEAGKLDSAELLDWLESLDYVFQNNGPETVTRLLNELHLSAYGRGVRLPFSANTPYINSIHVGEQPPFPGNRELERRIKSLIRWNAMAMVVRANRDEDGIGGHI